MTMGAEMMAAGLVGGIGVFCAVVLGIASRYFAVFEDPRIETLTNLLPGANCGSCGLAGCSEYARAIVMKGAALDMCKPGGRETALNLGAAMGVEVALREREVAMVMCGGGDAEASRMFRYNGIADCTAAALISGGDKTCRFGCLGLGTCARVCPARAIEILPGRLALVHPELCVGCGLCVKACPKGLIRLVPESRSLHVLCSSRDKGAAVRKYCKTGCIACGICAKLADGAIRIDENLAVVDYAKAFENDEVVRKCPQHTIVRRPGQAGIPAAAAEAARAE